jgi:homoserine kinase type II
MGAGSRLDMAGIAAIADQYGLAVEGLSPLPGGVENSSYLLSTPAGSLVLTVLQKKDLPAAASYAAFLCSLAEHGLPVPRVLPRRQGGYVTSAGGRPVIVSEHVAGRCYDRLPAEHLPAVGAVLARLHTSTGVVCPLDPYIRLGARELDELTACPDAGFGRWVLGWHGRVGHVVEPGGRRVPTHGDLFPDNLIVRHGGDVVLVDWDDGALDHPWIDVGMAVLGLCCHEEFLWDRARLLVAGYRSVAGADIDLAMLLDATIYVALFTAYRRFRRRAAFDPTGGRRSYRVIPGLVASMLEDWDRVAR